MLYPFTAASHILEGGFALGIVWYSLLAKRHLVTHLKKYWISWFVLFMLYHAFLGLPSLLGETFSEIIGIAGILFIAGLSALGLGAWNGFILGLSFLEISQKARMFLSRTYLVVLGLILVLFGVFFENPRISEDGNWIFWHSNLPHTITYSFLMLIAAWTLAYSFVRGLFQLQEWKIRFCSLCMAGGSAILPLAAFFYFAGRSTTHLATAFVIVFIGLSLFLLGNVVARRSSV